MSGSLPYVRGGGGGGVVGREKSHHLFGAVTLQFFQFWINLNHLSFISYGHCWCTENWDLVPSFTGTAKPFDN